MTDWWAGWTLGNPDQVPETVVQADKLQLLVNQEVWVTMGCCLMTNLVALSIEPGLRAVTTQLENRQQRFGLRLQSLSQGDQVQEVIGALTRFRETLTNALVHKGPTERVVLLEKLEAFYMELLQEEEAKAKSEPEESRSRLMMFTDESQLGNGTSGYTGVWKNRQTWEGIMAHMGINQEAYNAEWAAIAHVLEPVTKGYIPEQVTIFTDAQAAIKQMALDEHGPGQQHTIQAQKHIATLYRVRPFIIIKIQWFSAYKSIASNEEADEWVKTAAEKPRTCHVEHLVPSPPSLANLTREISEKKWAEVWQWAGSRTCMVNY